MCLNFGLSYFEHFDVSSFMVFADTIRYFQKAIFLKIYHPIFIFHKFFFIYSPKSS